MSESATIDATEYPREPYRIERTKYDFVSNDELVAARECLSSTTASCPKILEPFTAVNARPQPLRRIIKTATNLYGAFGVLEWPYVDPEFINMHSDAYDRWYLRHPIECSRLHFFAAADPKEFYKRLIGGASDRELPANEYFGFVVLKPTRSYSVGRAALSFLSGPQSDLSVEPEQLLPPENGGSAKLDSSYTTAVHLVNARFTISSCEFIQQDPNLGRCATAAIWVITRVLARRVGLNKHSYSQITMHALRGWSQERQLEVGKYVSTRQHGLTVTEVCNALSESGARPLVVRPTMGESAAEMAEMLRFNLDSFLDSGIPVVASLHAPGESQAIVGDAKKHDDQARDTAEWFHEEPVSHAVAVLGKCIPGREYVEKSELVDVRSLRPSRAQDIGTCHRLHRQLSRVYYVHDDSYGPFTKMALPDQMQVGPLPNSVQDPKKALLPHRSSDGPSKPYVHKFGKQAMPIVYVGGKDDDNGNAYHLSELIAAVPQQVRCSPVFFLEEAMRIANQLFAAKRKQDDPIVWRPVLVSCAEFKQSLYTRAFRRDIRRWYGQYHLPRYVWLFEYSICPEDSHYTLFHWEKRQGEPMRRRIHGELLFDATLSPWDTPEGGFVCGRFEHICVNANTVDTGDIETTLDALPYAFEINETERVEAV